MVGSRTPRKEARGGDGAADSSQVAAQQQQYAKFLEQRIQELMDENKRYLSKYADLRAFAYNQIESLVKKHANANHK